MCGGCGPCCWISCFGCGWLTAALPAAGILFFSLMQWWSLHYENAAAPGCSPGVCSRPCLSVYGDNPDRVQGCEGCPVTRAAVEYGLKVVYAALVTAAVDVVFVLAHVVLARAVIAARGAIIAPNHPRPVSTTETTDSTTPLPRALLLGIASVAFARVGSYTAFAAYSWPPEKNWCVGCRSEDDCGIGGPFVGARYFVGLVFLAVISTVHAVVVATASIQHRPTQPLAPQPPPDDGGGTGVVPVVITAEIVEPSAAAVGEPNANE